MTGQTGVSLWLQSHAGILGNLTAPASIRLSNLSSDLLHGGVEGSTDLTGATDLDDGGFIVQGSATQGSRTLRERWKSKQDQQQQQHGQHVSPQNLPVGSPLLRQRYTAEQLDLAGPIVDSLDLGESLGELGRAPGETVLFTNKFQCLQKQRGPVTSGSGVPGQTSRTGSTQSTQPPTTGHSVESVV